MRQESPAPLPKRPVVLLVEDEAELRELLGDFLESEGLRVLRAGSAGEAFDIIARKPRLDLLITDYRLPGDVSGARIAEPALKLRPDLKLLFISGYPTELHDCGSPLAHEVPLLAKPFALSALQQQVNELLGRSQ